MNELNHALQRQVDKLGQLCCEVLIRDLVGLEEKAAPLVRALVQNGYDRLSDVNLQTRIEAVVHEHCPDRAMHRRDELTGMTRALQQKFTDQVRWKTSSPGRKDDPKGANISSGTDA